MNRDLIPTGSRVLCAVSGGADSMCLLDWLRTQADLTVCAAHFEHGLRGEESLRDAAFVEQYCQAHGIPCLTEHGSVSAYARQNRLGIEAAAREMRYAFLYRAAERLNCDLIATAHTADDNAETLLMNLCRGAGAAGLSGIPARRGKLVRPLLDCTRKEIEEYLKARAIPHVEDSSNGSDAFRRNRLRHQVLPVLREMNPRFAQAAGRTAALLREDEACLSALASDFLRKYREGNSLPIQPLLEQHRAVSSRVLRMLAAGSLEREHVETALDFCQNEGLGHLDLPGLSLRREQGSLYWGREKNKVLPDRAVCPGQTLSLPEAGLFLTAELLPYEGEVYDLFKTFLFKYENICGTLYCTGRRPGDRFHPQGRGCGKRLHDLFRDAGLTQQQRELIPVFRDDQGVVAVYGYPPDERVRPEKGDTVLRIQIQKTGGNDGTSD